MRACGLDMDGGDGSSGYRGPVLLHLVIRRLVRRSFTER
jgi:hypothetical protein